MTTQAPARRRFKLTIEEHDTRGEAGIRYTLRASLVNGSDLSWVEAQALSKVLFDTGRRLPQSRVPPLVSSSGQTVSQFLIRSFDPAGDRDAIFSAFTQALTEQGYDVTA